MSDLVWILSCGNRDLVPDAVWNELTCAGNGEAVPVTVVPDLCNVAMGEASELTLEDAESVRIVCYRPRAVRALLEWCGRWPGEDRVEWVVPGQEAELSEDQAPWFPVVDRSRCSDCGQCHAFCLFGVYSRDKGGVVSVTAPSNCKQGCPACARMCPEAAIIFPLLAEAPFNGDAVSDDEEAAAEARRRQEQMMASDPYRRLKARRNMHKRRLVDPKKMSAAMAERERCRADAERGADR